MYYHFLGAVSSSSLNYDIRCKMSTAVIVVSYINTINCNRIVKCFTISLVNKVNSVLRLSLVVLLYILALLEPACVLVFLSLCEWYTVSSLNGTGRIKLASVEFSRLITGTQTSAGCNIRKLYLLSTLRMD